MFYDSNNTDVMCGSRAHNLGVKLSGDLSSKFLLINVLPDQEAPLPFEPSRTTDQLETQL
jgi:hypothetical protein